MVKGFQAQQTHMDNADLSVLRKIAEWRLGGHRVVMGTIVRTWGSAPRPVGSLVAVRDDGQVSGSVSGGCIEDDLVDKVRTGAYALSAPSKIKYGISAEEANRFGLPCGGTLELVLEPVNDSSRVDELLASLADGRPVRRTLDLKTGKAVLEPADGADTLNIDEHKLVSFHGPRWRLLIIGAGQMTHYLASMARALDYEVVICDPREEYADGWNVEGTRLTRGMPDDTVIEMKPDAHMAVIALTHDPKLDDLALMEALKSEAFYVGAIGSRANQEKRRRRLLDFDVSPEQLARLHGPVGLKNGARTPPEIAVSILAQLTAERYGYRIPNPVLIKKQQPVEAD
jgi:xanthine dehydrogenase accessory factor